MSESYPFTPNSIPIEINVSYTFTARDGHVYQVTFVEVTRVIDILDDLPVISNAIYVIVDVIHPSGPLFLDVRIGITIVSIVKEYLKNVDRFSILVFNCDIDDGKQVKRHKKFDRWFRNYASDMQFEKIDEEILQPAGEIYIPTFISVLFSAEHPRRQRIFEEIDQLRSKIGSGK